MYNIMCDFDVTLDLSVVNFSFTNLTSYFSETVRCTKFIFDMYMG